MRKFFKISAVVDGGLIEGTSVHRPGSKDLIGASGNFIENVCNMLRFYGTPLKHLTETFLIHFIFHHIDIK